MSRRAVGYFIAFFSGLFLMFSSAFYIPLSLDLGCALWEFLVLMVISSLVSAVLLTNIALHPMEEAKAR